MRALVVLSVVTLASASARAQVPETAPAAAPATQAPADADAWRAYDDAFRALVEGRRAEARRLVDELAARPDDHPAVARARALLRLWPAAGAVPPPALPSRIVTESSGQEEEEDTLTEERPSHFSRAFLATSTTFFGIAAGIELCVASQCDSAGAIFGLPLVLGGGALGATLVATEGGVRPGAGAAIENGFFWGTWNAFVAGDVSNGSDEHRAFGLMLGQGIGMMTGGIVAHTLRPTSGQVSLASSVGMWTGFVTWFVRGARNLPTANDVSLSVMATTSDIALVGGSLLAAGFPVSHSHALLIDAGGIGGTLLGMGAVAIIGGSGTRWTTYYKAMVPSTLVGLAAAAYFTRDWDLPEVPVSVTVAPTMASDGGAGAVALVGGRF
jgi:hypothetical protein